METAGSGAFSDKLRAADEIALEMTGKNAVFHEAVAPHVGRAVIVDPNQFKVISQSVKKTDPNDTRKLALYLAKCLVRKCAGKGRAKRKSRA